MTEQEMNGVVFDRSNLRLLHDGFELLHDVFLSVASEKDLDKATCPPTVIREKLDIMLKEKWNLMMDIFTGNGQFSQGELYMADQNVPAKLLLDLIYHMDSLREGLYSKVETYRSNDEAMVTKMKEIQLELQACQDELREVRYKDSMQRVETNTVTANIDYLEKLNKEKTEQITQLKRDSTVQLWEKEKQRIFEKHRIREKELEEEVQALKIDKESTREKLADAENKLKIQRMKTDISPRQKSSSTDILEELEQSKKHVFMLEKDLRRLETELFNQQKYVVGIMSGLKHDQEKRIRTVNELCTSSGAHLYPKSTMLIEIESAVVYLRAERYIEWRLVEEFEPGSPVSQSSALVMKGLYRMLCSIHHASAHGSLGAIRADLPNHYIGTDKDVKSVPIKKLSSRYGVRASLSQQGSKMADTAPAPEASEKSSSFPLAVPPLIPALRLESPDGVQSEAETPSKKDHPPHPELVNPDTGFINMIKVMTHFPHMTKDYVHQQWDHFKQYDKDRNGTLDLSEMMQAMGSTLGNAFSAQQIRDAMKEVDVDDSDTIDFYEYLSVANMVMHKTGKSEVFRSKVVQQQASHVSKTCVVM